MKKLLIAAAMFAATAHAETVIYTSPNQVGGRIVLGFATDRCLTGYNGALLSATADVLMRFCWTLTDNDRQVKVFFADGDIKHYPIGSFTREVINGTAQ